ncbi:MAG: hypothetical protein HYX55_08790 [Chloroflexi bacterium]|nr:hypothetical protein [Chloroflexota bacterium]
MNPWSRAVARIPLSPGGRTVLAWGLSGVGFALLGRTLLEHGIQGAGGGGGIDAIDYWNASRNLAAGLPLHSVTYGQFLAYSYPPILAQLLLPFTLLPSDAFVWLWRALELACLRVAVGSWRTAGIALLGFPPLLAELDAGNIHLIMAAACSLAMRGHAFLVAPAGLLKFASLPLAPLGWVRDRRGFLLGIALALAIVSVSIVVAADRWAEYLRFLTTAAFPTGWYNLAEAVPLPLRLGVAIALGIGALRWVRLAPFAVLLAYPVVWFHGLATLVSVVTPLPQRERGA